MKYIPMAELKPGDIFTHELKLNNREAFLVIESKLKQVVCYSRNDERKQPLPIKKNIKGTVILLNK